jgi:bifunctional oligoribonuclease and PAP phosphatase NrnA
MNQEVDLIKKHIKEAKNIYLTTHINPDDDAIGSLLGMYGHIINNYTNKEVVMLITGSPQKKWDFLINADKIEWVEDIANNVDDADLIVVLDCSDTYRATKKPELLKDKTTVAIDHHQPEENSFTVMEQRQSASSTAQIIADSFLSEDDFMKIEITKPLFMGLYQDSGGFMYITKDQLGTFATAQKLMEKNQFDIQTLLQKIKMITPETYEVWQNLMKDSVMVKHPIKPYIYSYATKEDTEKYGKAAVSKAKRSFLDGCAKKVEGFGWGFVTYPAKGNWEISFRSTPGNPNVQQICKKYFNGNGHTLAAGGQMPFEKYQTAKDFALDTTMLLENEKLDLTEES